MVKIRNTHLIICDKYGKFKNPKMLCIFQKVLVLSIISSKCGRGDRRIFKEEKSIKILKFLCLIKNI